MVDSKICGHCKREKPLGEFSPRRNSTSGRTSWCKSCANAKERMRYARKKNAVLLARNVSKGC